MTARGIEAERAGYSWHALEIFQQSLSGGPVSSGRVRRQEQGDASMAGLYQLPCSVPAKGVVIRVNGGQVNIRKRRCVKQPSGDNARRPLLHRLGTTVYQQQAGRLALGHTLRQEGWAASRTQSAVVQLGPDVVFCLQTPAQLVHQRRRGPVGRRRPWARPPRFLGEDAGLAASSLAPVSACHGRYGVTLVDRVWREPAARPGD